MTLVLCHNPPRGTARVLRETDKRGITVMDHIDGRLSPQGDAGGAVDRTPSLESTLAVIRELVEISGVEFDEIGVRRLLAGTHREAADDGEVAREVWLEDLHSVLVDLGLRVRRVRCTAAQALPAVERGVPVVGLWPSDASRGEDSESPRWVVVSGMAWNRVQMKFEGESRFRTLGRRGFVTQIDPDREVDWILVYSDQLGTESPVSDPAAGAPWRRFLRLLRPDRADIWVVAAFAACIGIMSLATPLAVQVMVTFVAFGGVLQPVLILAILLFCGLGFAGLLRVLESYVVEILQRRIFVRVASDLAHRLPRVRALAFDGIYGPEKVNRFFDVMTVQKVTSVLLLDGLYTILNTVIGLVVLAFYHPTLLIFGVILLLAMFVVVFLMGRGAVRTAIAESKAKYRVAGWFEEVARLPVVFKHGGGEQHSIDRADQLTREYLRSRKEHFRILLRQITGAIGIQVLASVALLGIGGVLVIQGSLTLGQLVAAELIVTVVVASFSKIGKHLGDFYDLMAAVDKLGELFDLPLESSVGENFASSNVPARLEVRSVRFAYAGERPLFDSLSFGIPSGARAVLTGPNRSGKSTLLGLLFRLRRIEGGHILLDDLDQRSFRLSAWRNQVALVRQSELFRGSVSDNVRVGRDHLTAATIRECLDRVGVLEDLLGLPDGLETVVGSGGHPLTESQAQRLCIARAMAGSPRLLLVDEPLDHLGMEAREATLNALFSEEAPWTLLVVSDRADVRERADTLLRLREGRVDVESSERR